MRRRSSHAQRSIGGLILAAALLALPTTASAADYSFTTDGTPEYYSSTSYEDVYDAQYNYGGPNAVDYQIPELEYGQFSTTQTGVMEKALLPGLQAYVATSTITSGPGGYGISGSGSSPTVLPGVDTGAVTLPPMPQFTELTDEFLLSNGAIGRISIPAIGVRNFYLWQGETASSMNKGLGHFTSTSVWDGNVGVCGHNRGARYNIGEIKDLDVGDTITYTTSEGTRSYKVETVRKIASNDWSYLEPTSDNRITLITCVAGDYSVRWCVQAVER